MSRLSPSSAPGLLATALIVAGKEIREAARDRQTLIYTLLLPLAMYPVMFWIMLQVFLIVQAQDARTDVSVSVVGNPLGVAAARIDAVLTAEDEAPAGPEEEAVEDENEHGAEDDTPIRQAVVVERLDVELERDALTALLLDPATGRAPPDAPDAIVLFDADGGAEVLHVSTRGDSRLAAERVQARLTALGDELRAEALLEAGRDPATIAPFAVKTVDLSEEIDRGGMILSLILPMMFVVMTVMGSFFPAVDITAGEKERRTAETTLLVPAPRSGVQLGKVLTVAVAAAIATTVNLVGMGLAAEHLLAGFGSEALTIQVPWLALLRALPLGLVFLLATSAVMVAVASFADTFKQGQALLNSVMMVAIFPAIFAIMPGVELSFGLALVPVVQTALGFKALIAPEGLSGHGLEFALVVVSQLFYAGLALWLSLRLTTREALATNSAKLGQIKRLLRSSGTPS